MSAADPPPSVSFLCSAHRTERYLPDTIASVLAQTRTDWQLVVVDNGMDDAIRDVVLAHPDPRVVLRRQENAGVEGGVATAAAAATGRYVAVLHSDDAVAPDYVARLAGLLDAHPEVDAVACDAVVVDDAPLWLGLLRDGADIRVVPDRLGRYRWRSDSLSRDPESLGHYQATQAHAYLEAASMATDPRVHEALARRLRRLGYVEALGRARTALLRGDVATARAEADAALRHRVRPRSVAVAAVVHVAPRVLGRAWPLKQRAAEGARRAGRAVTPRSGSR